MRVRLLCTLLFATISCDGFDDSIEPIERNAVVDYVDPPAAYPPIALSDSSGRDWAPVHATVNPDGSLIFIGLDKGQTATEGVLGGTIAGTITPHAAYTAAPAAVTLDTHTVPVEMTNTEIEGITWNDTLFCGGQVPLDDGKLFVAGGSRIAFFTGTAYGALFGVPHSFTWDPTGGWTRLAAPFVGLGGEDLPMRWYSSAIRLNDGRVLVTGGYDRVANFVPSQQTGEPSFADIGPHNHSIEVYDPQAGSYQLVASHADAPAEIFNPDYSHVFELPYDIADSVLIFGETSVPVRLDVDAGTFSVSTATRPGSLLGPAGQVLDAPNNGASTAPLPMRLTNGEWGYANGAVAIVGGNHQTSHQEAIDVYDPVFDVWHPRLDLGSRRHHPSTVALPDGRILIVAGHDDVSQDPALLRSVYFDPMDRSVKEGTAPLGEFRGYHNVAALLPDGRVLIGGGRTAGPDSVSDEKADFRYLYPDYMLKPRGYVGWAPEEVERGEAFWVAWGGPEPVEAVLMRMPSMTHSVDFNQRYVQIANLYTDAANGVSVLAIPDDATLVPPGHYMLFLVDAERVPSIAKVVKVL